MDKLKKVRTVRRRAYTQIYNKLTDMLKVEDPRPDYIIIEAEFNLLRDKREELRLLDNQIFDLMLEEDEGEDKLQKEVSSTDEFSSKFNVLQLKVFELLKEKEVINVASEGTRSVISTAQRKYKLPVLELKKFSGDAREWLQFWAQFKKIDEDASLDSSDKFQYLLQATTEGSRARDVVGSYPATAENYPKAVEALKARFGRDDILVEVYIRELLGLVLQASNPSVGIPLYSLYDRLESHLRALETLKVTTDKCEAMLFPLMESCLPEELLRAWQRSLVASATDGNLANSGSGKARLTRLMDFLRSEVEGEERISMAMAGFGLGETDNSKKKAGRPGMKGVARRSASIPNEIPTATGLLTTIKGERRCIFCYSNHNSQDCIKAQNMTLSERRRIVDEQRVCFCCLRSGHIAKRCKSKPKCIVCGKSHFTIICNSLPQVYDRAKGVNSSAQSSSPTTVKVQSDEALASLSNSCDVQMQTLVVKVIGKTNVCSVRTVVDTASQRSYILTDTAVKLGYQSCRQEAIQHSLFGGTRTDIVLHDVFIVYLSGLDGEYRCHFEALGQATICADVSPVRQGPWIKELSSQHVSLSDVDSSGPIEILIGADIAGKLLTGNKIDLNSGLVAIETKLGWTLMGKIPQQHVVRNNLAMLVTSMFVKDATLSDLWTLDTLGIMDPAEKYTKMELEAATQLHFLETVSVTKEGRFEVHLPWIANHPSLPDNYSLALKRMNSTIRKLRREQLYDEYQEVLNQWIAENIIEEVLPQDLSLPCHYLPHRHVVKPGSTTPVRPVFDASAREYKGPSLNQCLEKGPNLIEKIPSVLARFRLNKVGVVGDIRRAFLQISVYAHDRNVLRFLWTTEKEEVKVYRHCRVVFGVSSSPFLLEACIKLHLETTLIQCKEGILKWPIHMVELLAHSFYVDNCISSLKDEEQAQEFIHLATSIMKERGFELRGWEFTNSLSGVSPNINVLGIQWNRMTDTLKLNVESLLSLDVEKVTKKVMLSAAHRIFDPIGVACSVSLVPKILLQQTWEAGMTWDQEVTEEMKSQFLKWFKDASNLSKIEIPRWLPGCNNYERWTLHVFSDACQTSYATAAFLRVDLEHHVRVQLVSARARVSPICKPRKRMTIPRLELLGASIAARMYSGIVKDFGIPGVETIFWTDSTTVLAWIERLEPWDAFVFNRIKEIRELTTGHVWRHVPGHKNPADLPSRGCSVNKLLESHWWEGPDWLQDHPSFWPQSEVMYDENEINKEKRKTVVSSMLCESTDRGWYYQYFSQYKKMIRMIGWICRFRQNCKVKKSDRIYQDLTAEEYEAAENKVISIVQGEAFSGVSDPKLSGLVPFVDKNGIIRLKTKVSNRNDVNDFCHPAVLPNQSHPVVSRMIMDLHRDNCHAGAQMMMTVLRQRFWILGGRRTLRVALSSCIRCKRHVAKKCESVPTPLPADRVRYAKIFEITGMDMAGPLYLKVKGNTGSNKAWVCLFTCGVYRAVHLELVSSLSTDIFVQAFQRFISRRGRPRVVYTDQGTNFIGAENALKKMDWTVINQYSCVRRIEWKFNPPAAPWWGGWWERLIALLKKLLRRVLGQSAVDYEEMQTILCDCESIINSRPLTYISQDPEDLTPLTPSMFLQDVEEVGIPDFDLVEATHLNRRLQYRHLLKETLRERFRSEYLGQLKLVSNKGQLRELSVGEIVLVGSDNTKRLNWPLARVTELMKGKDGHVRVVRVKTSTGELVRPVQRIYPLELDLASHESKVIGEQLRRAVEKYKADSMDSKGISDVIKETDLSEEQVVTRCGRLVKLPKKLNL